MKKFIVILLLVAVGFSIMHEYIYTACEDNHCSPVEYISNSDAAQSHGNHCAIHFEYHQSYLLFSNVTLQNIDYKLTPNQTAKETYNFKTHLEFYKPPIA